MPAFTALFQFLAFDIAWASAVAGGAGGWPWIGAIPALGVLALHLFVSRAVIAAELGAVLAIALFGILLEAGFMGAGLVNFAGHPVLGVLPPVWVWALWLGFASLPNGSLVWLQGRPVLQAGLGLVFGPLAYWTGAKMGAAAMPTAGAFLVIALAWALAFPVIMAMAARLSPRQPTRTPVDLDHGAGGRPQGK
ncbi:hypothetical protein DK847_14035 [Aestuariivirga litoralis]|uniref:DUF2878 domain-containing protein n=1 Tax=Aestuariivirga litoralis TaxID=2650924 RepID=A0A2W2AL79_9HYPH|nr:DUF2878 domain-containing protein [Aestuariivirga litoralis]PZF76305.1 hypothetical protein DK847_14035 [Aestuariivirga litoralis]